MTAADLPPVGGLPTDGSPAVRGPARTATPAADATPVEPVGAPHADRLPADKSPSGLLHEAVHTLSTMFYACTVVHLSSDSEWWDDIEAQIAAARAAFLGQP